MAGLIWVVLQKWKAWIVQIKPSDVWLKVLIDDSEENFGWIHPNEEFSAVGLPPGSPAS